MERNRILFGVLCLIGFFLMAAYSFSNMESLRATAPFVMESAYFNNLDAYDGEKVFLVVWPEGRQGDKVYFTNMNNEPVAMQVSPENGSCEGPSFVEVTWDAGSETLTGAVIYELEHIFMRQLLSLLGLFVFLLFFRKELLSAIGFGGGKNA